MKRKTKYYHTSEFNDFLRDLKKKGKSFEMQKTNYTRKIKTDTHIYLFNEKADKDSRTLKLINRVRKEAKEVAEENEKNGVPNNKYNNINFYKLLNIPTDEVSIVKVDINSAYWQFAINEGIISKETDELFNKMFRKNGKKEAKAARLKALGSLATSKEYRVYENGKPNKDKTEFHTEKTKDLYMHICGAVDELLKEASITVNGVYYYYWDCLFMNKEFQRDAIEFFNSKGFDCKTQDDTIEFEEINGKSFIISKKFDKCYMVREEDKHLAEWYYRTKHKKDYNENNFFEQKIIPNAQPLTPSTTEPYKANLQFG
jgi:hypothetical protein